MTGSDKKLSIIIASRGDFYGGDQIKKIAQILKLLSRKVARLLGSNFEIILVDYNVVNERAFVDFFSNDFCQNLRIISVDQSQVSKFATSERPFVEYHAKNIGIQNALGSQIAVINTDVRVSNRLLRSCLERPFVDESFLRVDRTDLIQFSKSLLPKFKLQIRNGAREKDQLTLTINQKTFFAGSPKLFGETSCENYIVSPPGGLVDHFIGGAHGNASGDFVCAPRTAWQKLRGYNEDKYVTSMGDAFLLSGFFSLKLRQVILSGPFHLIHRDHPRPNNYQGDWTEENWILFKEEFRDIQLQKKTYPIGNRLWPVSTAVSS